jgi:ATP-dependent RNA helicase DeaD
LSGFKELNLLPVIQQALTRMKFETPTPIQAMAIPVALQGRDIIGCAQTGTGKTAAFGIPLVTKLIENPRGQALILAPTRELALQICDVLVQIAPRNIGVTLLIGGIDMHRQLRDLMRKPAIIVGTPGRVADHLRRKSLDLSRVQTVVLDEADRMLDMGFERQINEVLSFVPKVRQTLLFSATIPDRVKKMATRYQKDPQFLTVGAQAKPVSTIKHSIVQATKQNKREIILDELNSREGSVIIFVNTKHGTNRLWEHLEAYGYAVTRIHGGRSQGQRNQALLGFRSGKYRVMVATDLAARGIDVPHIQHVINFDLPKDVDDYVHRIGRTARAGAEGHAICLLSNEDRNHWNKIAKAYNFEMLPSGGRDRNTKPPGQKPQKNLPRPPASTQPQAQSQAQERPQRPDRQERRHQWQTKNWARPDNRPQNDDRSQSQDRPQSKNRWESKGDAKQGQPERQERWQSKGHSKKGSSQSWSKKPQGQSKTQGQSQPEGVKSQARPHKKGYSHHAPVRNY